MIGDDDRWFKCSLQDEPIGQWLIKRNIDGKDKPDFPFDQNFVMKPGAKVKVSTTLHLRVYCAANVN